VTETKPAFTVTYAHEARLDLDIGYQRVTVGDLRALVRELDRLHVPDETVFERVTHELFGFTTYTGLRLIVPLASAPEPEAPESGLGPPNMREHLETAHAENDPAILEASNQQLDIHHRHLHLMLGNPGRMDLCGHPHPDPSEVTPHEHQ
jgi:hypothetical protein